MAKRMNDRMKEKFKKMNQKLNPELNEDFKELQKNNEEDYVDESLKKSIKIFNQDLENLKNENPELEKDVENKLKSLMEDKNNAVCIKPKVIMFLSFAYFAMIEVKPF